MEFRISKESFLKGLSRVQNIADKRQTQPVLSNVLMETGEGWLNISATDLEVGIRGRYDVKVSGAGALTVSAKKLFEIVRELPDEEVYLKTTEEDWLEITCGKVDYKIVGLSAADFPVIPSFEEEDFATISVKDLLEMGPGQIVELDKMAHEPLDIYVNSRLIARGKAVQVGDSFGIKLTDVVSAADRIEKLG